MGGGGHRVDGVLVGRRRAAHAGARSGYPARDRAGARARARAARGAGPVPAASASGERVSDECRAGHRADGVPRWSCRAGGSAHGPAGQPLLAARMNGWRIAASPRYAQRGVSATPQPARRGGLLDQLLRRVPRGCAMSLQQNGIPPARSWWPGFCAPPRRRLTRGFGRARGIAYRRGSEPMVPTTQQARAASAPSTDDAIDVVVAPVVGREVAWAAALLSDAERQRASRFLFDRDRDRFIVGRARLRQLLAARLGTRPESVELVYGAHGKPALARRFADSDLRFNVSHCDDVTLYAFSCGREIGVDVEAVRVLGDADDIAGRFFSHRENQAYRALERRDRPLGFFQCWTRKEAFIKALGDGLSYPLDRFDVSLAPGEPAEILRVEAMPGACCGWRMESLSPAPGFVAAVVIGDRE